jgi:Ca2+-binding EF-hand superfamily protein
VKKKMISPPRSTWLVLTASVTLLWLGFKLLPIDSWYEKALWFLTADGMEIGGKQRRRGTLWMMPWRQFEHTTSRMGGNGNDDSENILPTQPLASASSSSSQQTSASDREQQLLKWKESSRIDQTQSHLSLSEESEHLINLFHEVTRDLARREGYIHRGITCNQCRLSPIRGIRYKCANCMDYDLCELCESQELHLKTHVFLKIRIPIPPLANPRETLMDSLYPGLPSDPRRDSNTTLGLSLASSLAQSLSAQDLRELQRRTHFDQVELEALYEQFRSLTTTGPSPQKGITKSVFEKCLGPLGVEKNLITDRIFSFFDQDGDGRIDFSELVSGLSILCKGTREEKMYFAFRGYDIDGDGRISRDELRQMFKAYFYLSMDMVRDVVHSIEQDIFEKFDETSSKPVSASFTAPIPPSHRRPSSYTLKGTDEPVDSQSIDTTITTTITSPSSSIDDKQNLPVQPIESAPLDTKRRPSELSDSIVFEPTMKAADVWPTIEALSRDAIEEMVDRSFRAAHAESQDFISYEEFKLFVEKDPTAISWFNTFGTVF